ncbi:MAG: oligosaccharide flippase family protein [Acidimicrobiales bacterium]
MAFFAATGAANAANFGFHVVMSRMLGPATYGALGSILGLATVVTLAVTALQAAVTQTVAEGGAPNAAAAAFGISRSLRRSVTLGLGLFAVVVATAGYLAGFLHLSSPFPVALFGAFVAVSVVTLVPQGVLIGRLRFRAVAVAMVVGAALRLALGTLFVAWGWGLSGAVAATVANALATLALLLWPLRTMVRSTYRGEQFRLRLRSSVLAVVALGGLSGFIGLDTFLARHFLSRVASGYYVAGATAARIALFLPAAIGMMAFPRLVSDRGVGSRAKTVLVHSVLAVAALGTAAAVVIILVPHVLIAVLFGARYQPGASALRILAAAAAGLGVVNVLVYFLLARRSKLSAMAWGAILAGTLAVSAFHSGPTEVAWVMLIVNAVLLLSMTFAVLVPGRDARLQKGFGRSGRRWPRDLPAP